MARDPSPARPPARRLISPAKAPATTPPPLTGVWAPTDTRLDDAVLLPLPSGHGPEDVVVDPAGRVLSGAEDGTIWRWPAGAGADPGAAVRPEALTNTGGRPLGIEVDPTDGSLIVCDAYRGLLRLHDDGRLVELARSAAGKPLGVTNNAAVARDGTVFFTDSSDRYPVWAWKRDLLEYRPNGRLLAYRPGAGSVDVLATDLYFPNGVAITPAEDALLFVETSAHLLRRLSLTGGGGPTVLADLPAYPDNMCQVGDGTYWIALPSPRVAIAERLLPFPRVRRLAALLPDRVQPQPKRHSMIAQVDGDGAVLRTLHAPAGGFPMLTGVRQHGGTLWLSSLTGPAIARAELPASG
jgi:sugar lactone lactonase YvrE